MQLKVAMVTELFYPSLGGQQTRFRALATGLTRLGDDVTIICTRNDEADATEEVLDGVRVLRTPLLPRYEQPFMPPIQRSPVGVIRFAIAASRIMRDREYDAAYFNQWPYLHVALAPRRLRHRAGIDWCEYRAGLIHRAAAMALPGRVAFNDTVNEWTGRKLAGRSGRRYGYLPTGVSVDDFRSLPASDRSGLLFLGRFVENKNLPLLVRGFAELRRRGVADVLRIAGGGPQEAELRAAIDQLPSETSNAIVLEGAIDDERKRELLSSSRALLLPSRREGFPNVVAEAMASGLPIATVRSPLNGAAHVVERYRVGSVGRPDTEGFVDAVLDVLNRGEELVSSCLASARELDWPLLARQLHGQLEEVAARARDGASV